MEQTRSWLEKIFGVVVEGQTYLNILYILLAFPLGLFYFIFFVVGFSLGIPLIILWVGILILLMVFAAWWVFILFERQQAISLLRVDLPPLWREDISGKTTWEKVKSYAGNPTTWLGLLFLLLKFPVGIICFVVSVSLIAITGAFVTAPLTYSFIPLEVAFDWNAVWVIDTFWEAVILFFAGLLVGLASFHIMNGMAWVLARLAKYLLGDPRGLAPSASTTAIAPLTATAAEAEAAPPTEAPVAGTDETASDPAES